MLHCRYANEYTKVTSQRKFKGLKMYRTPRTILPPCHHNRKQLQTVAQIIELSRVRRMPQKDPVVSCFVNSYRIVQLQGLYLRSINGSNSSVLPPCVGQQALKTRDKPFRVEDRNDNTRRATKTTDLKANRIPKQQRYVGTKERGKQRPYSASYNVCHIRISHL